MVLSDLADFHKLTKKSCIYLRNLQEKFLIFSFIKMLLLRRFNIPNILSVRQ
jgi:hypothetical protein